MNYLNLKKQFPKSVSRFFQWVSSNHKTYDCVDNAYFRTFFGKTFRVSRSNSGDFTIWIIDDSKHLNELKSYYPNNYYENHNDIRFLIDNEDDFDILFNCMEILITKKIL
jgi:hypothetical protein